MELIMIVRGRRKKVSTDGRGAEGACKYLPATPMQVGEKFRVLADDPGKAANIVRWSIGRHAKKLKQSYKVLARETDVLVWRLE